MSDRSAIDLWREKLAFLQAEEALASGAQQFAVRKGIENAKEKLRELGEDPDEPRPTRPSPLSLPRLPPRPPRCFGRAAEVEALVAALCAEPPSPTPLLGGPGMGKSTISLEALHDDRVRERFGARRFFVRLEASSSGEAMVRELARGVGVEVESGGGGDLVERVLGQLERGPAAVVLDNLETPWWAEQGAVEEVLARLGGVASLALAVSLRGGKTPLKIRWGKKIEVGVLPPDAARRTFLEIAGGHLEGDPHLDGLLAAVDRVALAVELLAHQAEDEPDLAGLKRRWDRERTKLLQVGEKEERLLNLGASLELSIQSGRMTPAARRLLALLGKLPDGIALEDLPAVMEDGDAAAGCLRQVGLAAGRNEKRLQLLAPVREHVAARYEPEAEDLARAGSHYLQLAALGERAWREGGAEAIARLSLELNNLDLVIKRQLRSAEPGPAIDAAIALGPLFYTTGLGGQELLELAEKVARAGRSSREADCIRVLGNIAFYRSEYADAQTLYEHALALYQSGGILFGQADCIKGLGDIDLARSQHAQARSHYEQAIPLYQRSESPIGEANCIRSLGDIALERSKYPEARSRFEKALPLYRRAGAPLGEANCLQRLGDICLAGSDLDEARSHYEQALVLYQRVGDVIGEANCILSLGEIARHCSDNFEALSRYEQALPLFQRVGDLLGEANCLLRLAKMEEAPAEARRLAREALALYGRIPEPYSMARAHVALARLAEDPAERRRQVTAARALWERIDRPDLVAELREEFGEDAELIEPDGSAPS